ncbi:winged helix-turn-helix domain-containing protein [Dyella soli]|uniref:Winged helix family transcriptional regulator n=1 Tax=Dyella soli TaxID=522319 RepID=A0A4R0YLF3_9GAMM|nr:helix-turn-helix domain-containing protein [Dyella soli]TCI06920.1 winged helix family transcriptional regulator [Dyella soli]
MNAKERGAASRSLRKGPGVAVLEADLAQRQASGGDRWHLDAHARRLVSPKRVVISLSMPERRVLDTLMAAAGAPVGREALIAVLADDVYDFDPHRLDMLIHRLRRKIGEHTSEPPPLLTARGKGFLFDVERQY